MARGREHTNPRTRKPVAFKGTWKGRNYRRGIVKALAVNFLVFGAILGVAVYAVHLKQQARNNPKVWTLSAQ